MQHFMLLQCIKTGGCALPAKPADSRRQPPSTLVRTQCSINARSVHDGCAPSAVCQPRRLMAHEVCWHAVCSSLLQHSICKAVAAVFCRQITTRPAFPPMQALALVRSCAQKIKFLHAFCATLRPLALSCRQGCITNHNASSQTLTQAHHPLYPNTTRKRI